ncbi:hypothetical protein FKP32DRAFT_89919 [Trametes sanguinea]|nr:hypothetical protein FKP32DRAFT_89919 [Trametes sanguinea]
MMAIYGIGSYAEPIVVSDEEDAAIVEKELNRWNEPSSSSLYEHSTTQEMNTPSVTHAPPPPATYKSTSFSNQKRKRQEAEVPQNDMSLNANWGKAFKRARKQDPRKDRDAHSTQSHAGASSMGMHRQSMRLGAGSWSEGDSLYSSRAAPPGIPPRYPSAQPLASPVARSMPTYWPSDLDPLMDNDQLPPFFSSSYQEPATSSWGITPAVPLPASVSPYEQPTSPLWGASSPDFLHASITPAYEARAPQQSPSTSRGSHVSSQPRTKTSGRSVSALDDSLRRLEALSASLLAMSAKAPEPLNPSKAVVQPPADPDKRQIGRYEDEGNFGSFDLSASTLLPPLNPNILPPHPSRTIVVAHLPKKFRVRTFVESWAKRFGTSLRTEIDSKAGKALIEYGRRCEAEAAFASKRLRGEGKEHIRVYWYQGFADVPARAASTSTLTSTSIHNQPSEIEDGEIEEGEVVELAVAPAKPKRKKKGKKEKARASQVQLAEPVAATSAPPLSGLPPASTSHQSCS